MNALTHDPSRTSRLARDIRSAWLGGVAPDAQAAIEQHPDLAEDRSAAVDLAYEEYCLRREAGEVVNTEEFCARFPGIRSELRRVLCCDQVLADHASMVRNLPAHGGDRWPLPGDTFRDCLLVRELGSGTFSRVYLALEHSAGDRPVALKLSSAGGAEARMMGRLHHDHVVPILWAARDEATGLSAVCMPFLGSATLAQVIDRLYPAIGSPAPRQAEAILDALRAASHRDDPVPDALLRGPDLRKLTFVEGASRLALAVAEALAFLHPRGLYHCDLKPSNLLLTPLARPLLLDFNLSRAEGKAGGLIGGTFTYMAPEQLRVHAGAAGEVGQSAQADLFSFGVILYELLTGELPFGRPPAGLVMADLPRWLLDRMAAGPVPLARLNPEVPRSLAELVERCLALQPTQRPASAAEVVRRLRPRASSLWAARAAAAVMAVALLAGAVYVAGPRSQRVQAPVVSPEPSAAEMVLTHRAAGFNSLKRAVPLVAAGKQVEAEPLLREASARFRKALDLGLERPAALRDTWKDHLNQGYALLLLRAPADARGHLLSADRACRLEALPPAMLQLGAAGAPLKMFSAMPHSIQADKALATVLAARSYCCARQNSHNEALLLGEQALERGYQDPRLLNNLGYSALKLGSRHLPQARHYLAQALCLAPSFHPALFNSCQLVFQETLRTRQTLPEEVLVDVDAAIALLQQQGAAEPAELYRVAAQVYARSALDLRKAAAPTPRQQAELVRREQRAWDYLQRGCVLGLDVRAQLKDPILVAALGDRLRPESLRALRQQEAVAVLSSYLVDPLGGPVR